jgi:HK97 family phage prohead protease
MNDLMTYDFRGMATRYNVLCDDGRVILPGAFDHQDGERVPLVWHHGHQDISNVLGHAILRTVPGVGMAMEGYFNSTISGQNAKEVVKNEDIRFLSIWANKLNQVRDYPIKHTGQLAVGVRKGQIREVSLVFTGANPGASIEDVVVHASDESAPDFLLDDGVIIHSGEELETMYHYDEDDIYHAESEEKMPVGFFGLRDGNGLIVELIPMYEGDEPPTKEEAQEMLEEGGYLTHAGGSETIGDILSTFNKSQKMLLDIMIHNYVMGDTMGADEVLMEHSGRTIQDVFNTLTEKQKNALVFALEEIADPEQDMGFDEPITHSYKTGETTMKRNIFEDQQAAFARQSDSNDEELLQIVHMARQTNASSLRQTFASQAGDILSHAPGEGTAGTDYGIANVDYLFPDARNVDPGGPRWYNTQPAEWVDKVMGGTRKVPFSRIKSMYADITAETARAKGYITGAKKDEQVFNVLRRVTTPTTVYKMQRLDRDDVVEITDFDVVRWMKGEMQIKMREELARAILISDGRSAGADKVSEDNIRPIYTDDDVYAHKILFASDDTVHDMMDAIISAQLHYRGTGQATLFMPPSFMYSLLLLKDTTNRRLYASLEALANALNVKEVVPVPYMENVTRDVDVDTLTLKAILVNPGDYTVGMNNLGKLNFFDDFDLNYNQYQYLYETRMSGALTIPKSAIVFEQTDAV